MKLYSCVLQTIASIILKLTCDKALTVIIGLLTIIVAINVFSGELVLDKDSFFIEKKYISSVIDLYATLFFVILTLMLCLLKPAVKSITWLNLLVSGYILIFLNVCIRSTIFAIISLCKITNNSTYHNKDLFKYIATYIDKNERYEDEIHKKINKRKEKGINQNISIIEDLEDINHDEYAPIIIDSNQFIIGFKNRIRSLNGNNKIKMYDLRGLYCKKGTVVGYYFKKMSPVSADNIFEYSNNYYPRYEKYTEVLEYLFKRKSFVEDFDKDKKIYELYTFLCDNHYSDTRDMLCEQIIKIYYEHKDHLDYLDKYIDFVNSIKNASYSYGQVDNFQKLLRIESEYIIKRIENNEKYIFCIDSLILNMFSLYSISEPKFYEVVLSESLLLIYELMKEKKFEQIEKIMKNSNFMTLKYDDGEIGRLNVCFIVGLIRGVFHLYFNEFYNKNEANTLLSIIKDHVRLPDDGVKFIRDYLYNFKHRNRITSTYELCPFFLEEYEFGVSRHYDTLKDIDLLVLCLDVLKMNFIEFGEIVISNENRKDIYYYQTLKELIQRGEIINNSIDYKLEYIINLKEFKDFLDFIIDKYKDINDAYSINNNINERAKYSFLEQINDVEFSEIPLLKILSENNLIRFEKLNEYLEFDVKNYLPREEFFENDFISTEYLKYVIYTYYESIFNYYCAYINQNYDKSPIDDNTHPEKNIVFINDKIYSQQVFLEEEIRRPSIYIPSSFITNRIMFSIEELPILYISVYENGKFVNNSTIYYYDLSDENEIRTKCAEMYGDSEDELKKKMLIILKARIKIQKK